MNDSETTAPSTNGGISAPKPFETKQGETKSGENKPGETKAASAKPSGPVPRRLPTVQAKPISMFVILGFVVVGAGLVLALLYFSHRVVGDSAEKVFNSGPQLQGEFNDRHNSYGIRPPVGWTIRDPHDQKNIYITGPNDAVFPPMIVINLDIKAGSIASYMQEHKGRIQFENKTAQFISDDPDSIDGAVATRRFVYDLDHVADNGQTIRLRTLQYILEDKPRFYRVTCHARVEDFDRLLPFFEASARTLRRTKVPTKTPQPLAN